MHQSHGDYSWNEEKGPGKKCEVSKLLHPCISFELFTVISEASCLLLASNAVQFWNSAGTESYAFERMIVLHVEESVQKHLQNDFSKGRFILRSYL